MNRMWNIFEGQKWENWKQIMLFNLHRLPFPKCYKQKRSGKCHCNLILKSFLQIEQKESEMHFSDVALNAKDHFESSCSAFLKYSQIVHKLTYLSNAV